MNNRIRVGITGQHGFIGSALCNYLKPADNIEPVDFNTGYFQEEKAMRRFVAGCDVIVHLAAISRHENMQLLYETNIRLVEQLISAMEAEKAVPYVVFASTTHEPRGNLYHKSKILGRQMLDDWAQRNRAKSTGVLMPNVFGPNGRPYYNSVIATFCYQLTHGEMPEILIDASVELIYIKELCRQMYRIIIGDVSANPCYIPPQFERKVSEILDLLKCFKTQYLNRETMPAPDDEFEAALFDTFLGYIDRSER